MNLSRREQYAVQALQLVDAFLVWAGFGLASLLRGPLLTDFHLRSESNGSLATPSWVLYLAVPFTPLMLEQFGYYERLRIKSAMSSLSALFRSLVVMTLLVGVFGTFAQMPSASRAILALGGFIVFVFLWARDRIFVTWVRKHELPDDKKERVVVAGAEMEIREFLGKIDAEIFRSWKVVGQFDLRESSAEQFDELLKMQTVERVVFLASGTEFGKVTQGVEACELQGVEACIATSFVRTQIARPVFDVIGGMPMLVLRTTPELSWQILAKEVIDRVGAGLAIMLTLPLWIVAAIGIRITSPGAPVLFSQKRAGRYGKSFRMWKFRTMVANAEALLDQIKQEHGNQMDGPVFKLDRDPRVFPFGALLRKLSIDELPQLLNVVLGQMSLVGPRPLPLYEIDAISEIAHRRRLSVKPGITCEWQAGGRNKITSFEEWVEMDLRYIDNWSLWLDFKILVKTVPAVLFGKGAK
jgi:exopolysaccharide biosynthesis polyprenyl glycosylphosphotransferase